jgi:hypothetical protein
MSHFIIKPRHFHDIIICDNTVIKKGNLKGENYYYKNIPECLKVLFPKYISGDDTCIIIEFINGLTISELYTSESLDKNTLLYILNSINIIHNCDIIINDNVNIYENYIPKLKDRYNNFDYTLFKNSKNIYETIVEKLEYYEKNNKGIKKIIHGDPVFTNILINKYGKIKFIDIRGKLGNKLTIYGDWLYDWAKIYQSIIGYDEILLSKSINIDYKENIIKTFKDFFINHFSEEDFENLKIITKSLIFTLIPLHNNKKCFKYYDLIFSKYLN